MTGVQTCALPISAHLIIDNALGHGTAKGAAVFVAGDGVEAIHGMSEAGKKFTGAAAAVITLKFDSDELAETEEALEKVREKLERTQKIYAETMAAVLPQVPKLQQFDAGIKALGVAINQALSRSYDAGKNYDAIRTAIRKSL